MLHVAAHTFAVGQAPDEPPPEPAAVRPIVRDGATLRHAQPAAAHVALVAGARGVPKSGRAWKRVQHKKFSSVQRDGTKELSTSWAKKEARRNKHRRMKELEQEPRVERLERQRMGFKAWYDNRADDLTKDGMLKGIEQAAAFILFLR